MWRFSVFSSKFCERANEKQVQEEREKLALKLSEAEKEKRHMSLKITPCNSTRNKFCLFFENKKNLTST